jgi:hypothetical protein
MDSTGGPTPRRTGRLELQLESTNNPNDCEYNWATLILGDINTDQALQVGGVSDETVIYVNGSCATLTCA